MEMRVNAINMLRQAAEAIDPKRDRGAYAYMLECMADDLEEVRDGRHSWEEFAETYCLAERDRKPVPEVRDPREDDYLTHGLREEDLP